MVNRDVAVVDDASWAQEVDLISNDHYTWADDTERHWELAMSADRCREGVAQAGRDRQQCLRVFRAARGCAGA